jgi:chromosome segregation ATPase
MRRELDQVLADNRGMVLLMGRMEKQLSEFGSREERVEAVARECKAAADQALVERDAAVATEAYLRAELSRLRDGRVQEYEHRAAQHGAALADCKGELTKQLRAREAAADRLVSENERLRVACDAAKQDRESADAQVNQLANSLDAERRAIGERCRSLQERAGAAEERASALEKEAEDARAAEVEAQAKGQRSAREVERKHKELDDRRSKLESDFLALEDALEAAAAGKDKAEREAAFAAAERDALASASARLNALQRDVARLEAALADARHQGLHLEVRLADAAAALASAQGAHAAEGAFLKADKARQEELLTSLWERERSQLNAQTASYEALNLRLVQASADLAEAQSHRDEALERASAIEAAFEDSQQRLSELSIAVAEAGVKEQQRLREHSRLKAEVARLSSSQSYSAGRISASPVSAISAPVERLTG